MNKLNIKLHSEDVYGLIQYLYYKNRSFFNLGANTPTVLREIAIDEAIKYCN